ncbi:hypothetical protein BJ741DRAFT_634183 [Chytriomyces cf. hyalinus JEL632]|nr:hypothetical protein BJ741DRAFT_634183 [Chytriomyces cf. hyalinus JEL632]
MGSPKKRGRRRRVDQSAGFSLSPAKQRRQGPRRQEIEIDDAEFAAYLSTHASLPSNFISPVKMHQSELQLPTLPKMTSDMTKPFQMNLSNKYGADTDTGTDTDEDDLEFCVVGGDGQSLTDASSRHHQSKRQKFVGISMLRRPACLESTQNWSHQILQAVFAASMVEKACQIIGAAHVEA